VAPDLFLALRELRARGVQWAVNTGRTLGHLEEGLTTEFGFPVGPDFAVVEERDIYRRGRDGKWEPFGDWNAQGVLDHEELFRMAGPVLGEVLAFIERLDGASAIVLPSATTVLAYGARFQLPERLGDQARVVDAQVGAERRHDG
jgi:hypothetical protein